MTEVDAAQDWTEEYENILEFFFWEPQHLNRSSQGRPSMPLDEVMSLLRRREVPLNHLLNFFFRLAPSGLVTRLCETILPGFPLTRPRFMNSVSYRRSPVYEVSQPDIFFEDNRARLFIEIKLDARTSIEQLAKYALASLAWDREAPSAGRAGLIWLGPSRASFKAIEPARADSAMRVGIQLPERVSKFATAQGVNPAAVTQRMRDIDMAVLTFAELDAFLALERQRVGTGEAAECLAGLLDGMRRALARLTIGRRNTPILPH